MKRLWQTTKGFTLVEMLITAGLFAITSVLVGGVFINVNNLQQQTSSMEKLQNDGRYMMEKMGREIRGRELNYNEMSILAGNNLVDAEGRTNALIFNKDEVGEIWSLGYNDQTKEAGIVILKGDVVNGYTSAAATLNSADVSVDNLQFVINPLRNPYENGVNVDYIYQPKVTVFLTISNRNVAERYRKQLKLQTTISSKVYH